MAGLKAFREAYITADILDADDFESFDGRKVRYDMLWAYFQGNAYREIHKWSKLYKVQTGLYKYVRDVYNPAYRVGDFYQSHLMGGILDPLAGDGKARESALPILVPEENGENEEGLRRAVAALWADSNWGTRKDLYTLRGATLGDVGLQVVDDVQHGRVYLDVLHPGIIKSATLDRFGNVKAYEIEEERPDPEKNNRTVTYGEMVKRDGDVVVYQTTRNGQPYAWPDNDIRMPDGTTDAAAEWSVPYGFIPLVMVQHNDVGLDWGWAEVFPALSKFRELDDQASKLNDQVRKMVDSPWFISGIQKSDASLKVSGSAETTDKPEVGREEVPLITTTEPNARATPMVANLDISATIENIKSITAGIERDYPELQLLQLIRETGDISGRALRTMQQEPTIKVLKRRANYDEGLVRAQKMAIAIGGYRGYEDYAGFGLDSFEAGALEHSIDERPVFARDPLDDLEIEKALWETAQMAVDSGAPLETYLRRQGWTDEDLTEMGTARLAAIRLAQEDAIPDGEQ